LVQCIKAGNIPNGRKIFQITTIYNNISPHKILLNIPKLGFLVWKETIWHPWLGEKVDGAYVGKMGWKNLARHRCQLRRHIPSYLTSSATQLNYICANMCEMESFLYTF
jgi:hypothetical protein